MMGAWAGWKNYGNEGKRVHGILNQVDERFEQRWEGRSKKLEGDTGMDRT